jgi:hypothetical protein
VLLLVALGGSRGPRKPDATQCLQVTESGVSNSRPVSSVGATRFAGGFVGQTATVTFRPQLGPPASAKQVQQLRSLLEDAGYLDFRSARGPLGLTQRQGLGKFTNAEAEILIEQLELENDEGDADMAPHESTTSRPLRDTPTDALVAELRLRGWTDSKS